MPQFTLIQDIKEILLCSTMPLPFLKGEAMSALPSCKNSYLIIEDRKIHSFGSMSDIPNLRSEKIVWANNGYIFPSWVDSHTHLVFAAWREQEFMDRIEGLSYEEISRRGGGILHSAKKIAEISESELYDISYTRLQKLIKSGTGAIEIKSGYGLSVESELKILRVIKRLKENSPIPIKSTFLGAHSFPLEYRSNHSGYVDLIIHEMLPEIAKQSLADYCDVFCEKNFFSVEETREILLVAQKYGLDSRIHTNQFTHSGGIPLSVEINAKSVDHLEELNSEEIKLLKESNVIPCLLPGAAFFMNCPFPPATNMLAEGLGFCIATDFNPGTCPIWDMKTIYHLSVIKMRLNSHQALSAMTINGAHALDLGNQCGSIFPSANANFIITHEVSSLAYLAYGVNDHWISKVFVNGQEL